MGSNCRRVRPRAGGGAHPRGSEAQGLDGERPARAAQGRTIQGASCGPVASRNDGDVAMDGGAAMHRDARTSAPFAVLAKPGEIAQTTIAQTQNIAKPLTDTSSCSYFGV